MAETDWTRAIERIMPTPGAEDVLRMRTGVVDTVNSDGTVDVEVSGLVIPGLPVVDGVRVEADDTVMLISFRGSLIVLGRARTAPDPVLPDPVTTLGNSTNTVTATSWANLPTPLSFSMNFDLDCWVQIDYSAWLVKGTAGVDARGSVAVSGATTLAPQSPQWSQVMWANTYSFSGQMHGSKTVRLNAGTNTFSMQAYVNNTSASFNYTRITVTPLRWAS